MTIGRPPSPPEIRFWNKVSKATDCWEWEAGRDRDGYGLFSLPSGSGSYGVGAHRYSWQLHYGPIPDGMFVCHHCDNPPCVRPEHLFLGTHQDNVDDMFSKGRGLRALGTAHGSHTHPETRPRGETHGMVKLSEYEVEQIRKRYATGGWLQRELAAQHGVSQTQISRIVRKTRWSGTTNKES